MSQPLDLGSSIFHSVCLHWSFEKKKMREISDTLQVVFALVGVAISVTALGLVEVSQINFTKLKRSQTMTHSVQPLLFSVNQEQLLVSKSHCILTSRNLPSFDELNTVKLKVTGNEHHWIHHITVVLHSHGIIRLAGTKRQFKPRKRKLKKTAKSMFLRQICSISLFFPFLTYVPNSFK